MTHFVSPLPQALGVRRSVKSWMCGVGRETTDLKRSLSGSHETEETGTFVRMSRCPRPGIAVTGTSDVTNPQETSDGTGMTALAVTAKTDLAATGMIDLEEGTGMIVLEEGTETEIGMTVLRAGTSVVTLEAGMTGRFAWLT